MRVLRSEAKDPEEEALIAGLKAGDEAAYREAIARYSPQMIAAARSLVGTALAEDVVQDAWVTVLTKLDRFEGRAALSTWLIRIVSNRAISLLRARSREITPPSDDSGDPASNWFDPQGRWRTPPAAWDTASPEDLLSAGALQDCIDKHLALMPEQQRLALVMREIGQQSYDDICNELEVSASNVRVLLHRGRLRLMAMINAFHETGTC